MENEKEFKLEQEKVEETLNPYDMFLTDPELEQKGIVIDYGAFRIRVAHAGDTNKKFDRMMKARLKGYRHQIETETFADDTYYEIAREVYASTIILSWEVKDQNGNFVSGILGSDGKSVLPFDKKNIVETFKNVPRLFKDLMKQAQNFALFRKAEIEGDAKN